jgi:dolichol-phosphate mannosyltransferase
LHRKCISLGARLLVLPLTDVKDTMSGFFFIKREVIEGLKLNTVGYKLGLEIMVKGKHDGKIKEVPYVFLHRLGGSSKLNWNVHFAYVWHILLLYWYKTKHFFKRVSFCR